MFSRDSILRCLSLSSDDVCYQCNATAPLWCVMFCDVEELSDFENIELLGRRSFKCLNNQ
jgi:hypothetical protein